MHASPTQKASDVGPDTHSLLVPQPGPKYFCLLRQVIDCVRVVLAQKEHALHANGSGQEQSHITKQQPARIRCGYMPLQCCLTPSTVVPEERGTDSRPSSSVGLHSMRNTGAYDVNMKQKRHIRLHVLLGTEN